MTIAPRYRLPVAILASVVVVALVFLGVSFLGQPDASERPTPTAAASSSASPTAGDTPEAGVRSFFEAFAEARESSDPSVIEPFVNGTDSSAYLTAAAFLNGQAEQDKGSVVTVNELTNFEVDQQGDEAVVLFDHRLGGYDIELDSGEPLETPVVLPVQRKQVELVRVDDSWLVDSFEDAP
jgi:hypothetical protein